MAVPPAPDGRSLTSRTLVAALSALCLACVLVLVWLLAFDGARGGDGSVELDAPESRERVMSLGDQFVKRLGTYGPDLVDDSGQMPQYREQVSEVITPKFGADFDKQVAAVEQIVAQGGVARTTDVFATGVSSIDDDSARVLVAGAFNDTYTKGSGDKARSVEQEPLPFRFIIDLVIIDGEWLIDDFSPVGSDPEQASPGATEGTQ